MAPVYMLLLAVALASSPRKLLREENADGPPKREKKVHGNRKLRRREMLPVDEEPRRLYEIGSDNNDQDIVFDSMDFYPVESEKNEVNVDHGLFRRLAEDGSWVYGNLDDLLDQGVEMIEALITGEDQSPMNIVEKSLQ